LRRYSAAIEEEEEEEEGLYDQRFKSCSAVQGFSPRELRTWRTTTTTMATR